MNHPERSPERDAALAVVLDLVPEHGWSLTALRQVVADPDELSLLFPGGTSDLIEASCDLADRQMEQDAASADLSELGLIKRVKAVIAMRFARQRANRDAIRRAIAVLALPRHLPLSLKITTRTVDTHISRIRNKLSLTPESGLRLSSVYFYGYRLERVSPN